MPILLLRNTTLYDPANKISGRTLDVLVKNGKIAKVGRGINATTDETHDLKGKILAPGFIDMHVHLREPGQSAKETIATGMAAAAAGGFTTVVAMPNTEPAVDSPTTVEFVRAKAAQAGRVNVYQYGAITQGIAGEQLADMGKLAAAGVVGFTDDGKCSVNANVMRRAMQYAGGLGLPIAIHAEDAHISAGGVMFEGVTSTRLGLAGIPAVAEEVILVRDLALAEATGCRVHICHISTARGVAIVRHAKKRGVKVTAEVTPHHLLLTDADVEKYGPNAIMKPPLCTVDDRRALQEGLADGTIDAIASDHAPHTALQKNAPLADVPFGIIGLETTVPMVMTHLVGKKLLTLQRFIESMTIAPAKILGLKKGTLSAGADADFTVLDLREKGAIDKNTFASKGRNTPFDGWKYTGKAVMTVVGGRVVKS